MKKAAVVFIWVGMIMQFFLIYPIVVGALALKKLKSANTKNDLQTMGIITTFFCSLLGGIFMLCIPEEEFLGLTHDNKVLITKSKVEVNISENPRYQLKKTLSITGLFVMALLLIVSYIFSICICVDYSGVTFVPLLLNILQMGTLIFIIVLYYIKKSKFTQLSYSFLGVFAIITILQIVFSIISNYGWIYKTYSYYSSFSQKWVYDKYYGDCFECWVIMGCECALFVVSVVLFLYNFLTRNTILSSVTNEAKNEASSFKITSNVEIELLEVKRLFDNDIITQEEYARMRESVISKYYK